MLTPDTFAQASVYSLLEAAAQGKAGIDKRWLHAILDRGENAIPDLVRFGVEDRPDDPIPLDDELILIFQHFRSPEAVPFFVEYLRRNPEAPDNLMDAIYPIREAALEPLLALYDELEEEESAEVAFTLASMRIHDDRVLEILLDRLEYDVTDGSIFLGLYGDPAARPALEKMLGQVEDEHLQNQIQDAIEDLGRGVDQDYQEPPDVFESFPEKAGPETGLLEDEELAEMLGASDPDYRFAAAAGFINRDLTPQIRTRLLTGAQGDPDPRVRAKCWEALGGLVADDEEVFQTMLRRLEDATAPSVERAGALVGLGQRANEAPIRKYAEEFYANPETRAAALSAMWNSLDRDFSKYFPAHLDDPDLDVKKQAISGVGYLGIYESAEKLRAFFEDDDFRANAIFAYALSTRSEISPARIRSLLRRIEKIADGLTEEEEELVQIALDERLMLHGHKPVFHADEERHHVHGPDCGHDHASGDAPPAQPVKPAVKTGRNDPCPCGSGKKYKKCCGA